MAPKQSDSISVGANPGATFANNHLAGYPQGAAAANKIGKDGGAAWSKPEPMPTNASALAQLRQAVIGEDWAGAFLDNKTKIQAEASWSATGDRCAALQCLCTLNKAEQVLEIGSFCGAASLAIAEAIPKGGQVVALELEPFFVEFGAKYRQMSGAGGKIETKVGPAVESLKDLVAEVTDGDRKPFDLVVIDGDKSSMAEYLRYVRSQYFLNDKAVVCMDITPFKGQVPTRFKQFGAEEQFKTGISSGEQEIDNLRTAVASMTDYIAHEFGGLLVIQKRPPQEAVIAGEEATVDRDDEDQR